LFIILQDNDAVIRSENIEKLKVRDMVTCIELLAYMNGVQGVEILGKFNRKCDAQTEMERIIKSANNPNEKIFRVSKVDAYEHDYDIKLNDNVKPLVDESEFSLSPEKTLYK